MKTKLLRRLRSEIKRNTIEYLGWTVWLYTILDGVKYYTDTYSGFMWIFHEEELYKNLEHIALEDYVRKRRKNK